MSPWAYVLLASLAANAGLSYLWLDARDDVAAGAVRLDEARAHANACSDATEALQEQAKKREAENKLLRANAAKAAQTLNEQADAILSAPASDPDDCKAASQRLDRWLKGRK